MGGTGLGGFFALDERVKHDSYTAEDEERAGSGGWSKQKQEA